MRRRGGELQTKTFAKTFYEIPKKNRFCSKFTDKFTINDNTIFRYFYNHTSVRNVCQEINTTVDHSAFCEYDFITQQFELI